MTWHTFTAGDWTIMGSDLDGVELMHNPCTRTTRVRGAVEEWPNFADLMNAATAHRCSITIDGMSVSSGDPAPGTQIGRAHV